MRDAQVIMAPNIRKTDILCNRQSVTEFRDNMVMPRPPDMPNDLDTVGDRVRWWRRRRKMTQEQLVRASGLSQSTISGLENGKQRDTKELMQVAIALRVNPHYLKTNEGDPEADLISPPPAQPSPSSSAWPFEDVDRSEIEELDFIERGYAAAELRKALNKIHEERKKRLAANRGRKSA